MNTMDVIKKRRSYRGAYIQEAVPREDLIQIMEAGLAAPSGSNKQTTSLIAVDDPEILRKLYEINNRSFEKAAPAMICVLSKEVISYKGMSFSTQDYSAAIENMLLAAVDLGYVSCWIEGSVTAEPERKGSQMAQILGVPDEYELVAFLPIGKGNDPYKQIEKLPFEERAWFNKYGKNHGE